MSDGRVAVITGASAGIGEATARELSRRGWRCVLLARRQDRLAQIADEIGAEWEVCDVSNRTLVDEVAARVLERHPAITLLVNNAGVPGRGTFVSTKPETIERVLHTNYLGGVWCSRAYLPGLRAGAGTGAAHIVNVVSVAGTIAFAPAGPYAAAKHAQLAFSRAVSASLRGRGISVHTVNPGFVETEGFPQRTVLRSAAFRRAVIEPEDVARHIVGLLGDGPSETFVPRWYRLPGILQALAPSLVAKLVARRRAL